MSRLLKILKFISSHPLNRKQKFGSIIKFIKWQLATRKNPKLEKVVDYGSSSKIIISKNLTGATGNYYAGLHDYEEMGFLLHFLRKDDQFLDIGANVGSYSILASNEVRAISIAFEPAPNTFNLLSRNIEINNIQNLVELHNKGVGSKKDTLKFTKGLDTINHIATEDETNFQEVEVDSIDNLVEINSICMAKIDVEGFETEVINGMSSALLNKNLKAIIIELNGSGNRYGFDEEAIHEGLIEVGFKPYTYYPSNRELIELSGHGNTNTIYIRDIDFVNERLKNAAKVVVNQITF